MLAQMVLKREMLPRGGLGKGVVTLVEDLERWVYLLCWLRDDLTV